MQQSPDPQKNRAALADGPAHKEIFNSDKNNKAALTDQAETAIAAAMHPRDLARSVFGRGFVVVHESIGDRFRRRASSRRAPA
jgi:hypothetical protein